MALLYHNDLQEALNIDLTDPNGQAVADALIAATQAFLAGPSMLGFPIEQAPVVSYLNPSGSRIWLDTTAPVSELEAAVRNAQTADYDTLPAEQVIHHGGRELHITAPVPDSFHALRLSYTTGWTAETLPADLRQAIIDIAGLKLLEVANFSSEPVGGSEPGEDESVSDATGALKRVSSGSYTEEYSTAQSDAYWKAKTAQLARTIGDSLPEHILETVRAYRPPYAL